MTKKLLVTFVVMFVALLTIIGFILIKDSGKDIRPITSTVEPTETPEATVEPTVEPTMDPESDPRFTSTDSVLVFANKKHKLPDGYVPGDLVSLSVATAYGDVQMRQEAADAIANMFNAAFIQLLPQRIVAKISSDSSMITMLTGMDRKLQIHILLDQAIQIIRLV